MLINENFNYNLHKNLYKVLNNKELQVLYCRQYMLLKHRVTFRLRSTDYV